MQVLPQGKRPPPGGGGGGGAADVGGGYDFGSPQFLPWHRDRAA
jgi:hypothetical protein